MKVKPWLKITSRYGINPRVKSWSVLVSQKCVQSGKFKQINSKNEFKKAKLEKNGSCVIAIVITIEIVYFFLAYLWVNLQYLMLCTVNIMLAIFANLVTFGL